MTNYYYCGGVDDNSWRRERQWRRVGERSSRSYAMCGYRDKAVRVYDVRGRWGACGPLGSGRPPSPRSGCDKRGRRTTRQQQMSPVVDVRRFHFAPPPVERTRMSVNCTFVSNYVSFDNVFFFITRKHIPSSRRRVPAANVLFTGRDRPRVRRTAHADSDSPPAPMFVNSRGDRVWGWGGGVGGMFYFLINVFSKTPSQLPTKLSPGRTLGLIFITSNFPLIYPTLTQLNQHDNKIIKLGFPLILHCSDNSDLTPLTSVHSRPV